MTDVQAAPPAETASDPVAKQEAPGPRLVHQGSYALYRTPAGGLHAVYRRHSYVDDDTLVYTEIPADQQADEHLPELPPQLMKIMDDVQRTGKRPNPMEVLKMLMGGLGGLGDGDQAPDAVG